MWWLVVFVLVEGTWMAGDKLGTPGWGPRAYTTQSECLIRRKFAEKAANAPRRQPSRWFCTKNKSADLKTLEKATGQ